MALYDLKDAVFVNGVLVSGTWTPSEPKAITTSRRSSMTRYSIYPFIKDDLDGTAQFVEVTKVFSFVRVALTFEAASALQAGIEAAAFSIVDNQSVSGGYTESNRYVGSYIHETIIETKEERLVSWTEGPPPEEGENA